MTFSQFKTAETVKQTFDYNCNGKELQEALRLALEKASIIRYVI